MLVAGVAAPVLAEPADMADVEISLSRGGAGLRPSVIVAITNRSRSPICIPNEAMQNPESGELHVSLRDSLGRAVTYRPSGFIPPPIEGARRVEPGETVRARPFIDSRFLLENDGVPFPEGMSAQVYFPYDHCDDSWSSQATSTWQPI